MFQGILQACLVFQIILVCHWFLTGSRPVRNKHENLRKPHYKTYAHTGSCGHSTESKIHKIWSLLSFFKQLKHVGGTPLESTIVLPIYTFSKFSNNLIILFFSSIKSVVFFSSSNFSVMLFLRGYKTVIKELYKDFNSNFSKGVQS